VICVSEAVRNNMVEQGIGAENLVVIHNGVDPDRVKVGIPANEIRKEFEIEADAPIIGIGGNIRKWKGQEVVIRATSLIKKKFPNIRCFIIGDTGSEHARYKERLFNLVSELKLEGNIIFTGYRKNLADYFNAMDIVLHASVLPEPFGRVLIEAMALKKPLIGARGGAIPEIIEHEVTGLMCEPGNVEEYANAIERLLADNESAREMGRKAYERLQKEFHIKRNVEKTEQLYEQIFSRL
jgi:glycosyltransferase involved in cell wall biosynthesis